MEPCALRHGNQTSIDLSHNCARDPEKNRANASVGQKIWRAPRISSLFEWRNKRWRPCRLRFSGCSCAGLPIFQLRIASMSGQSYTSIFFVRFVSRAEIVAFFVGEGSQTRPQCAAVHSSFDTEKKLQLSPK